MPSPTIEIRSPNISAGSVPQRYIVVKESHRDYDRIVIFATWIVEGRRGKGTFQTPDGTRFAIRGRDGDQYEEPYMRFDPIA